MNGVNKYTSSQLGVSLQYPIDWSYAETLVGQTRTVIFAPQHQRDPSDAVELRIAYSPLLGGGLGQHINIQTNRMRNLSSEFDIQENKPLRSTFFGLTLGQDSYLVSLRNRMRGSNPADNPQLVDNFYSPNGQNIHELNYVANEASYAKNKPTVYNMISSLVIHNRSTPPSGVSNTKIDPPERPDVGYAEKAMREFQADTGIDVL